MIEKIGFTAGTYDMFHVGHLNLLKRAKQHCDKLIVGVNKSSLVESYKGKSPLIVEEQRLEIVQAIRYVDEAYLMDSLDKMVAYEIFKFNTVFIGSDYKGSERYKKEEMRLAEVGVTIEYLDYTSEISSTILSERIINNELNRKYYKLS